MKCLHTFQVSGWRTTEGKSHVDVHLCDNDRYVIISTCKSTKCYDIRGTLVLEASAGEVNIMGEIMTIQKGDTLDIYSVPEKRFLYEIPSVSQPVTVMNCDSIISVKDEVHLQTVNFRNIVK